VKCKRHPDGLTALDARQLFAAAVRDGENLDLRIVRFARDSYLRSLESTPDAERTRSYDALKRLGSKRKKREKGAKN
jgi:hypothetical protein